MLSVQEALLMKAVQDEIEREQAIQAGGIVGGATGALAGAAVGNIPHKLGNAINKLRRRDKKTAARTLKPGWRMAGGLTGMILAGGLGAGTAAMMKRDSAAGELLGKIQAQGGQLDELDERMLANMLGDIYNTPSQFM